MGLGSAIHQKGAADQQIWTKSNENRDKMLLRGQLEKRTLTIHGEYGPTLVYTDGGTPHSPL